MRHTVTPWSCACLVLTMAQAGSLPPVDGFYLGTLTRGNRTLEVGVTLETERSSLTGSYFYFGRADGSIQLAGRLPAGQTIRLEESTYNGRVTGRWQGKLVGGGVEGVWTNATNGQQWTFRLRRAEEAARFEGPVTTLETRSGQIESGPIAFRIARVPASNHRVPLITDFGSPRTMTEVNRFLMFVANLARCAADSPGDVSFDAAVTFAGWDVLSVRIVKSRSCEAAHLPAEDRSEVFSLWEGARLGFGNMFQYDVPPERLFAVLFPYELSRVQPGSDPVVSGVDDRACHDVWTPKSLAEDRLSPSFHLTTEGIVVQRMLPDEFAACANAVTVPYSAVGPVAVPPGPLGRLAKAHAGKPMRYRIHRPGTDPKEDIFFTPGAK